MHVFVSYARPDRQAVEALMRDLESIAESAWFDQALTGGQDWWDVVLANIRRCDLFLVAVSDQSLKSEACLAELRYALDVRRTLLPVLISNAEIAAAPDELRRTQMVDYRTRDTTTALALSRALFSSARSPVLPSPLPPLPPIPLSYIDGFAAVFQPSLTVDEQTNVFARLKFDLEERVDREEVLTVLDALRRRSDVAWTIRERVDALVGATPSAPGADVSQPATPPAAPSSSSTAAATGILVIKRQKNTLVNSMIALAIEVDGKEVGRLKNGGIIRITAPPGSHVVVMRTTNLQAATGGGKLYASAPWEAHSNKTETWAIRVNWGDIALVERGGPQ